MATRYALQARLRKLGIRCHGNAEPSIAQERDLIVDQIEAWAEGGQDNVNHWIPIARDAGVPMSRLRAANKALETGRRQNRTEGTLDRYARDRRDVAKELIEQVRHASRDQLADYWRQLEYFMSR